MNKNDLNIVNKIAEKTIGCNIIPTKKEDIGKEIKRLIEKATNNKFTTNDSNGLTENIILKENNE